MVVSVVKLKSKSIFKINSHLASTKKSYILKHTCSFQLQVCLSIYDLLVDTRHLRVNNKETGAISENCSMLTINCSMLTSDVVVIKSPSNIYLFKVNKRITGKRCEICSKLTIKTPKRLY